MTKEHKKYTAKLMEIGKKLGFYTADGRHLGKMYHMANPDCVWYIDCSGKNALMKIAKGEKSKYLPVVAFEVADSEKEKGLRGSAMSLQLASASAGIIVLVGKANNQKMKTYVNKLVGRFSSTRYRVWTEKDVDKLCC
ncbi:MAG TPA: hypothetical protein PKY78_05390 [Candidatus Omnitrophota bacterium]|nr:hypothetical protein [Candidatus Omnitrophota bacterium]